MRRAREDRASDKPSDDAPPSLRPPDQRRTADPKVPSDPPRLSLRGPGEARTSDAPRIGSEASRRPTMPAIRSARAESDKPKPITAPPSLRREARTEDQRSDPPASNGVELLRGERRANSPFSRTASQPAMRAVTLDGPPRISVPANRLGDASPMSRRTSSYRLANVDFSLANAARRIVEGALSVVRGEQLTVVVDRQRIELAAALVDAAEERSATATVLVLEELGPRPAVRVHGEVQAALSRSQASVFLAGFERLERPMRAELVGLVEKYKLRHAHMVGVTRRSWEAGFNADPQRVAVAARTVRSRLRPGSVLRLFGDNGTDLTVECAPSHRWIEHSGMVRPGRWENLPTGELVTAPRDVRGVFVCNASMSESFGERAGFLRSKPVKFIIEAGYVRSASSPDTALEREVRAWLMHGDLLDRVGLLVLGTNVGMRDPVGEILCDQNLPGLHIGLGTTWQAETGATWDAQGQLILASAYCDLDLDGVPLVRGGRYLDLA